jgi:uncharacterized repeat protein (TIGR01451 family)
LHQRLWSLQNSVFADEDVSADSSAGGGSDAESDGQELAPSIADLEPSMPAEPAEKKEETPLPPSAGGAEDDSPTLAREAPVEGARTGEPADDRAKVATIAKRAEPMSVASKPASTPSPSLGPNVLISRHSPIVSVETVGPPSLTVAKESAYAVVVRNAGKVAAEQLGVIIRLPRWAEVTATDASKGSVGPLEADPEILTLQWQIGRLEAESDEKLALRIVPRESRPIDLAVEWDYTPSATQAKIEVHEPKLEMQLHGPREVLFGQPEVYRLELRNTGTAAAENLEISMLPMGSGNSMPVRHKLGTVAAGEERVIEVEMTGRETGTLEVTVDVRGDAGVQAHLDEAIVVVRPELEMDVTGPTMRYVGTEVTWQVRLANPGTASAKNVEVVATLPDGAKLVSSSHNGQLDADTGKLTWVVETLGVGAESRFTVTCNLNEAGENRLAVVSGAEGDVTAAADTTTLVQALADLVLEVTDPAGPISVGTEVAYELEVQNRGTKEAEDVRIYGYFSEGIEPTSADGPRPQLGSGQVIFDAIPMLAAGDKVTLVIRARAEAPGSHVFRAEVQCPTLGAPLVEQETTHFYGDLQASQPVPGMYPGASTNMEPPKPLRTAERPGRPAAAPVVRPETVPGPRP